MTARSGRGSGAYPPRLVLRMLAFRGRLPFDGSFDDRMVVSCDMFLVSMGKRGPLKKNPGRGVASLLALLIAAGEGLAEPPGPGSYERMDYGPVLAETVIAEWPEENVAFKGLAIRLDHDLAMVFDTDLLRWTAATEGGWVDISQTSHTSYKGRGPARTEGRQVFGTLPLAGWTIEEAFHDPRPDGRGPLPRDWGQWRGYYRYGDRAVLSYTIAGSEVHEMPFGVAGERGRLWGRSILASASAAPLTTYVAELPRGSEAKPAAGGGLSVTGDEGWIYFGVETELPGVELRSPDGRRVELQIPPHERPAEIRLFMAEVTGGSGEGAAAAHLWVKAADLDIRPAFEGGPARWLETVATGVDMGGDDSAYVVDRIEVPFENPWGAWMRPSGFDFFADGRKAAVSTWNGDVWIVDGLGEEDLSEVRWRRFASGLYFPMGLAIVEDSVCVTERSQLTRLHDLNDDGEADFFENINNDGPLHPMAHALGLEVDSRGNFYFFKNGNRTPGTIPAHGALIRVSPDGARREVVAQGIRGANTLAVGPGDVIMGADQQGDWVPSARVDWLRDGLFYGFRGHGAEGIPVGEYEPPVCWIPHRVDNSSGGMVFAGDERWGPLAGNWIITSYGQCKLALLLTEMKGERMQGGVVQLPLTFASGIMRARMNPADGQLYLLGLRGWQTRGREDGSFDRVRYTGRPSDVPVALKVEPGGVRLTFSEPLDPASAAVENFEAERWQYTYSASYGSPEMSVADPGERGRDPVRIISVSVQPDGKSVLLEIPDLAPVMQMGISYRVRFVDGTEAENAVYHTIHRLRDEDEESTAPPLAELAEVKTGDADEDAGADAEAPWAAFAKGREIFDTNCTACHRPAGETGVGPSLSESAWAAGPPESLIRIVLQGKEGSQGVMMPFGWLSDEDVAEVLSYIRTRWHEAEPVSAKDVGAVRSATQGRTALWTEPELRAAQDSGR